MRRGDVCRADPSLEILVLEERGSVMWVQLLVAGELRGIPFALSHRSFHVCFSGPVRFAPDLAERGVNGNQRETAASAAERRKG